MSTTQARIDGGDNILIAPAGAGCGDFFGVVRTPEELAAGEVDVEGKSVYLWGDPAEIDAAAVRSAARVFVVREMADGEHGEWWTRIDLGRVPVRVHGAGVYYRRFFDPADDHFGRIGAEHVFQALTESTKPGAAHRSGIYLTPVRRDGADLHFRLLRCSTNLSGPTEGFGPTDADIVAALNREAATIFRDGAPLNHVLAQIYHNTRATPERKQAKAKISAHADKTKDMPGNGIMAFCTFYDGLDRLEPLAGDPFDRGVRNVSGLTKLRFRLKDSAAEPAGPDLPVQFELTLYPGSVFFMPLSTNRLYTHEIRPSSLDAESLPTRLGYVVRCSSTEAVHRDGRTFLKLAGGLAELEQPTPEGMDELRRLYSEENKTSAHIDYGDRFVFSMNSGDYVAPRV